MESWRVAHRSLSTLLNPPRRKSQVDAIEGGNKKKIWVMMIEQVRISSTTSFPSKIFFLFNL